MSVHRHIHHCLNKHTAIHPANRSYGHTYNRWADYTYEQTVGYSYSRLCIYAVRHTIGWYYNHLNGNTVDESAELSRPLSLHYKFMVAYDVEVAPCGAISCCADYWIGRYLCRCNDSDVDGVALLVFTAADSIVRPASGRNVFDKPNEQSRASTALPWRENDGRKANVFAKGK